MDETTTGKLTPFDVAVSKDSLQMLKATLPYMPISIQKMLAIYAKVTELSNTVSYFRNFTPELQMMSSAQPLQPFEVLSDLRQYTNGNMQSKIDQILFTFQTLQMMQSFQDMSDLGQEVKMNEFE